jgi:DNA-binding transcriptional MerR regulator
MSTPIRDFTKPADQIPLTIGKVAGMLGLHPQKVRRLEARGIFPPARRSQLFQKRWYTASDVAELWQRLQARKEPQ